MTANPDDLDRVAQYVTGKANELAGIADDYGRLTSRVEWEGPAAQAFRDEVGARRSEAHQVRQRLEQVADALRRGAEQIRRERAERERREREARERQRLRSR